jgi:glycosyltransferase involved in cell wall biosynthesis
VLNVSQRHYFGGGSDRIFFETGRLLEGAGHQVIPFCAADERNDPTPWERYFPEAADFERPGATDLGRYHYSRPARHALERLLSDHPVDIAHLHITYGKLTASILEPLRSAGIPIVQTQHEYKLICPVYTLVSNGEICEACRGGRFWNALPRRCNRGSLARTALSVSESYLSRRLGNIAKIDRFIAVSDFQRSKLIEHGLPADRIDVVHNFVDVGARAPGEGDGGYLLYVGRIERLKGVFTLIEAVRGLELPLRIVGSGEAEQELRERLQEPGFERVELLGFREGAELEQLLADSLATVVPSEWYEPFGLTVVEAMAHARPVIASDIGGITELVEHGRDGLLFPAGDAAALRARVEALADDPEGAQRMGRAGRIKVERDFGPERYLHEVEAIYRRLLDNGGSAQGVESPRREAR